MTRASRRDREMLGGENSPFYFNAAHWSAIDGVKEAISGRAGLICVTGPTGCGKTTTMRVIAEELDDSVSTVFINYANLNFREFVNHLHNSLRVDAEIDSARNNAEALRDFLLLQAERGEATAVFIDEAQNLPTDVLRMLPKLSRLGTAANGAPAGAQFVLFGDATLENLLDEAENRAVGEAARSRFRLRYFTRSEIDPFLARRLAPIARLSGEAITPEGIERIALYTGGSPRLLGMICAHAMLFAAEKPGQPITAGMVDEAAEALMMEPKEDAFPEEAEATFLKDAPPAEPQETFHGLDLLGVAGLDPDDDEDDFDLWEEGRAVGAERRSTSAWLASLASRFGPRFLARRTPRRPAKRKPVQRRRTVRSHSKGALASRLTQVALVLLTLGGVGGLYAAQGQIRTAFAAVGSAASVVLGDIRQAANRVETAAEQTEARIETALHPDEQTGLTVAEPVANAARGALDIVDSTLGRVAEASPEALRGMVDSASGAVANARSGLEGRRTNQPQIDALLAEAQAHFAAQRLTEPSSGNAYATWRRVLDIAPDNAEALEGVAKVKDAYVRLAEKAQANKDWNAANRYFSKAIAVSKLKPAP